MIAKLFPRILLSFGLLAGLFAVALPLSAQPAVKDVLLTDTNQINNTNVLAAVNLCKTPDSKFALGDKKIRGVAFDDITAPGTVELKKNQPGVTLDFSAAGTTGILEHTEEPVISGDDADAAKLMLRQYQSVGGGDAEWAPKNCTFVFHFGKAMANKPVTVQLFASYGVPKAGLPISVNGLQVGQWTMPEKAWAVPALYEFAIATTQSGDLGITIQQEPVTDVNFSGPCGIIVTSGGVPLVGLAKAPALSATVNPPTAVTAAPATPAEAADVTPVVFAADDSTETPAANDHATDMLIYADGFRSGWIDYGWAKANPANTNPVRGGSKNSLMIACKPFDGYHINHCLVDCAMYQSLSFWINGGETGSQLLKVGTYRNGILQAKFLRLPALVANAWKKVVIPLSQLGVAGADDLDGIYIGNIDGTPRTPYYLDDVRLAAVAQPNQLQVTVDAGQILQTLDDRLFALNNGEFETTEEFATHLPLAAAADIRTFRFPGGSSSDGYHWQKGEVTIGGQTRISGLSFDDFAAGIRSLNAQAFITVNYGSGSPQEAADWVKYSNVTHHYDLKYWEIGNECNLEAENDTNPRPHDPYTYATRASQYITQMKAVDPNIKIGVVIGGNENDGDHGYSDHVVTNPRTGEKHNTWDPIVLATLKQLRTLPDFVIHHRYVYLGGQEDDTSLLLSSRGWKGDIAKIRQILQDYLGDDASKVEIDVTEHNSTASAPAKQTTSLVNGLFVADTIGFAAETELKSLVFWCMSDDPQNPGDKQNLYGWRTYGGYGVMARVATTDPSFEVYPSYYVYKLMKRFGREGDAVISAESNYALLAAHAVKRKDGSLSLLVINKNPTAVYDAAVSIKGFVPDKNATVYSYGIPQDKAAQTKAGSPDLAQTTFNGAGADFQYTFPSYSATLLSLSPAK